MQIVPKDLLLSNKETLRLHNVPYKLDMVLVCWFGPSEKWNSWIC